MEAMPAPRLGKPGAKLLGSGHHPTPPVHCVHTQAVSSQMSHLLLLFSLSLLMTSFG